MDRVCSSKGIAKVRAELLKDVAGTGLEIGFGSGTNLPFFSRDTQKLIALDPAKLGRSLAKDRLGAVSFPVEFIEYDDSGNLPLPDKSLDFVVSTFTLCTVADLSKTLSEAGRVLRPGGKLYFLEHGKSPEKCVAFWQDKLTPLQKFVAGGCHLNRDIGAIVQKEGFKTDSLEKFYIKGPKIGAYLYKGVAFPPKDTRLLDQLPL